MTARKSAASLPPAKILHLQSSFAPGGKELRSVRLINAFGKAAEHTVISAEPEQLGAAARIDRRLKVSLQPDFPSLKGWPTPGRLQRIAKAMRGFKRAQRRGVFVEIYFGIAFVGGNDKPIPIGKLEQHGPLIHGHDPARGVAWRADIHELGS